MSERRRCRVLYVDDEPALLDLGKEYLEEFGNFIVETAVSAEDALKLIEQNDYDALISDYQMPRMDGIEFLKLLRANGDDTPFIIFTGKGREDVAVQAYDNGADFYVQKGGKAAAQFAELINSVKQAVSRHASERRIIEGERRLRSIVDGMNQGLVVVGFDGRVLSFNNMAASMTGVKEGDTIGDIGLLDPEAFRGIGSTGVDGMRKAMASSLRPADDGLKRLRIRKADGEYAWLEGHHSIIDFEDQPAVLIIFRDITDWVEAEEARRAAEDRYRSVVDHKREMVIRFAPDMKVTFANRALYEAMDLTEGKFLGKDVLSFLSDDEVERFKKYVIAITPSNPNCLFKHFVILDEGRIMAVEWDYHGIFDAEGNLFEYQAVGRVLYSSSELEPV